MEPVQVSEDDLGRLGKSIPIVVAKGSRKRVSSPAATSGATMEPVKVSGDDLGRDGRSTSFVVAKVSRQKLTAFGKVAKSLLDPILVPIVDKHWVLASILLIIIMLIFIVVAGAGLQLIMPAGTPGTFLQPFYDFFKSLPLSWHPLFGVICAAVLYFPLCGFYTLLDLFRPGVVQEKFMLQPRPAGDFGGENLGLWRTCKTQFIAYMALAPFIVLIVLNGGPHTYTAPWVEPCFRSCSVVLPGAAPSFLEAFVHFVFCLVLNDVTYWYFHWMCHRHLAFYTNIHKLHHEYKQPFSMVSAHLHPIEFMATYLFALVPPIACRAHPFTLWMLLMVGTTIGVEAHSGYTGSPFSLVMEKITFGLYGGTEHHDIHHRTPWCNYQPYFGHLDWLSGTAAVHETVAVDGTKES